MLKPLQHYDSQLDRWLSVCLLTMVTLADEATVLALGSTDVLRSRLLTRRSHDGTAFSHPAKQCWKDRKLIATLFQHALPSWLQHSGRPVWNIRLTTATAENTKYLQYLHKPLSWYWDCDTKVVMNSTVGSCLVSFSNVGSGRPLACYDL